MKKGWLTLLLVMIIVGAGCLPKKETPLKTDQEPSEQANSYTFTVLKKAVELGIPLKCTYKMGDVEFSGYIKGRQWRGQIDVQGKPGTVIMKDDCMYSWTDSEKIGTKFCLETNVWDWDEENQPTNPDVEYHCQPTVVTDAQFNPPADVEFMDLNEQFLPQTSELMEDENL